MINKREINNYYPFGLKHKGYNNAPLTNHPYKYNGKELNEELGLDWYDFGWRNYDASLGRWMNVDPLAELGWTFSPYTYVYNSPLYYIDPDGLIPIIPQSVFDFIDDLVNADFDKSFESGNLLDEVVVTAPSNNNNDEANINITQDGVNSLGVKGSETLDNGAVTGHDRGSSGFINMSAPGINPLTLFFIWLFNSSDNELEPNESTMENKNVEPVEPPKETVKLFRFLYKDTIIENKPSIYLYEYRDTIIKKGDYPNLQEVNVQDYMKAWNNYKKALDSIYNENN